MKRDLLKLCGGLALGILLSSAFWYFNLLPFYLDHFHAILIISVFITIAGAIWGFRKRRKILADMPKSTIEYLDHDGEN